ncbi:MAG: MFS transporter, partial [Candidatus Thiodiazotropha endolucinida]
PLALRALVAENAHTWVYMPVMLLSMAAMIPFVILAESRRRMRPVFVGGVVALVGASMLMFGYHDSLAGMVLGLLIFFTAFNLLEATLPSLVAKIAPGERKGTAMGVYSSSQFIGAFLGGALGGWFHTRYGIDGTFLLCAAMAAIWLLVAWGMSEPDYLSNYLIPVGLLDEDQAFLLEGELKNLDGVAEAVIIPEDRVAYLKVDLKRVDQEVLDGYAVQG